MSSSVTGTPPAAMTRRSVAGKIAVDEWEIGDGKLAGKLVWGKKERYGWKTRKRKKQEEKRDLPSLSTLLRTPYWTVTTQVELSMLFLSSIDIPFSSGGESKARTARKKAIKMTKNFIFNLSWFCERTAKGVEWRWYWCGWNLIEIKSWRWGERWGEARKRAWIVCGEKIGKWEL